jgi:hypothetical protein
MAIDTADKLAKAISGSYRAYGKTNVTVESVGVWHSYWLFSGVTGAGVAPSVGLNGQVVTNATSGVIPFVNAAPGNEARLLGFSCNGVTGQTTFELYDRLWQNSGIVVTTLTAQAITPVALPARDELGLTDGNGVQAWLEVYTATTNATAITNTTISYTNSAGTAGRTGTMPSFPATALLGTMVRFNLQAGDTGVRSIQSITLGTSYGAGAVGLVLTRNLGYVSPPVLSQVGYRDGIAPRCFDGTALCLRVLPVAGTVVAINGAVMVGEG